MQRYCEQDVEVTQALWDAIRAKAYSETCLTLEHEVATLCTQIERNGFPFDVQGAADLYARLAQERAEVHRSLKASFGSWPVNLGEVVPKASNRTTGITKGVPYSKIAMVEFNPSSRHHIADRLKARYGWEPTERTPTGEPQVDEQTLGQLAVPEAKLVLRSLLLDKRIGQVAEGKQAWLRLERGGKIHGRYITNGAVTGRATHSNPNIAQVPSVGAEYGSDCRALFGVPTGWCLVGADMSGLELRCLAHYMARYDDGEYMDVLLNGDIHTKNQQAAGLETRAQAKTFIYAFLYGAGDQKIGSIVQPTDSPKDQRIVGKKLKDRFLAEVPALGALKAAVSKAAKTKHQLIGLDGRVLHVRSEHAALNTLLQSAGAILCKEWIVST
jgi:DNA polymerase I-like protein with 3'-5' exonuclease and polymerase domains